MSNACYLVVILIFLVVTWWLRVVTGGYYSLPLGTACSHIYYKQQFYSEEEK